MTDLGHAVPFTILDDYLVKFSIRLAQFWAYKDHGGFMLYDLFLRLAHPHITVPLFLVHVVNLSLTLSNIVLANAYGKSPLRWI